MAKIDSNRRIAGLLILVMLILSGCSGSGNEIHDEEDNGGTRDGQSGRAIEETDTVPAAKTEEASGQMNTKNVLIEVRVPQELGTDNLLLLIEDEIDLSGFELDKTYQPVPVSPSEEAAIELESANEEVVLVRGTIKEEEEEALKQNPRVVAVWSDPHIEAFDE